MLLLRDFTIRDARMAGYKNMHEAGQYLGTTYRNLHMLDEFTQVLFVVKEVN